jgi:hypothetical protein
MGHWRRLTWAHLEELEQRVLAKIHTLQQRTADNCRIVVLRPAEGLPHARPHAKDRLANNDNLDHSKGILWLSIRHRMGSKEAFSEYTC